MIMTDVGWHDFFDCVSTEIFTKILTVNNRSKSSGTPNEISQMSFLQNQNSLTVWMIVTIDFWQKFSKLEFSLGVTVSYQNVHQEKKKLNNRMYSYQTYNQSLWLCKKGVQSHLHDKNNGVTVRYDSEQEPPMTILILRIFVQTFLLSQ